MSSSYHATVRPPGPFATAPVFIKDDVKLGVAGVEESTVKSI